MSNSPKKASAYNQEDIQTLMCIHIYKKVWMMYKT